MHAIIGVLLSLSAVAHGVSVTIKIPFSGNKCLDVAGGSSADGTPTIEWDCAAGGAGSKNQQFDISPVTNYPGYYQIRALHSGKCLGVDPNDNNQGAIISQQPCIQSDRQSFKPTLNSDGTLTIVSAYQGFCLDIWGGQAASGTNAIVWPCHGGPNQRFQTVGFAKDCGSVSCPSGTKSYPNIDGTCSPCYLPMWGYGCLNGKTCAPGLTCQLYVQGTSSTILGTCIQYVNAPCSNTPVLNEPFSLGTCFADNGLWGYSTSDIQVVFGGYNGGMACVNGRCKAKAKTMIFRGMDNQVDPNLCASGSLYYRDGNGKGPAYCN